MQMQAADLLYKAKDGLMRSASSLLCAPSLHTDLSLIHTHTIHLGTYTPGRKLFPPAREHNLSATLGTPGPITPDGHSLFQACLTAYHNLPQLSEDPDSDLDTRSFQ